MNERRHIEAEKARANEAVQKLAEVESAEERGLHKGGELAFAVGFKSDDVDVEGDGFQRLLGFSRGLRIADPSATADVLPQLGAMTWKKAMGVAACEATCRFLLAHTQCKTVLDPFCGVGTMLAVAEAHGMDAIGVELSPRRAAQARELQLRPRR